MTARFLRAATLLAAAVCSTLALAADPPSRVGRIAVAEGQVRIAGDVGDSATGVQVNWPVTSRNLVSTARGARTEISIGSTSLRLDGDTSLEVTELDDDSLRLRLIYGSINVRVRSSDVARGFELTTPSGLVRVQEPGEWRIDSDRVPGITSVTALTGSALVEDRGGQLVARPGKRLDVGEDIRTSAASRDGFDDWAYQRDQYAERSVSARYVGTDMTGYEDLDRHGVCRDDPEYGALWLPTAVGSDWAPYRDGSWTWISPWGWTWVDNAPWGYAPFHYGRWVLVNQRWAWAPGRRVERPVWAPALVGWVGGSNWNQNFNGGGRHTLPATGWYPLAPREAFVPTYRLSPEHLQRINRDSRADWRRDHDGRKDAHNGPGHERPGRDGPRQGLTVVPQGQFGQHGTIPVRNAPRVSGPVTTLPATPGAAPAAPPAPATIVQRERMDRDAWERNRPRRPELSNMPPRQAPAAGGAQPAPLAPVMPWRGQREDNRPQNAAPAPVTLTAPSVPVPPQAQQQPPAGRDWQGGRREGRPDFNEERRMRPAPMPAPAPAAPPMPAPPAQPQPMPHAAAMPEQQPRMAHPRGEFERRGREMEAPPQRPAAPMPAPAAAPAPVPAQAAAPRPAAPPAAAPAPERRAVPRLEGKRNVEAER